MLGNSAGIRRGVALAIGAILLYGACLHNVPQDAHSGADGKIKGAKVIALENGEGKGRGIVTYPGGDRVDWKEIDLPKDKSGALALKLSWTSPRPGLDLSFAVFDEYYYPLAEVKPRKHTKRTSKKLDPIPHAKGKIFVMVYASNRGDAGKYTLTADFVEDKSATVFDISSIQIPDPPHLPAVPDAPVPCDPKKFDAKNPACANVCPDPPDPKLPACKDICPTPPDVNNPACWKTMPCPNPPDRRVKNCMDQWAKNPPAPWPACDFSKRDAGNPNCDIKLKFQARVVDVQVQGTDTVITVDKGSAAGVAQGWKGNVIEGGKPVVGGDFIVVRVTKNAAVGKVKLSADRVSHANVELTEP
jgi:hypothetical protein